MRKIGNSCIFFLPDISFQYIEVTGGLIGRDRKGNKMCKECRTYPQLAALGAIDCHYKIAGELVAGIVGIILFAALVFYAPALMATEFWTDTCGYGVFNNWFEIGYYFQSSASAICDAAQIQSQSIVN